MLSLGEQQRLGIARACCTGPTICSWTKPPRRSTSRRKPRLPAAPGAAADTDDRLDRPPLDAEAFHRRRLSRRMANGTVCAKSAIAAAR